MRENLSVHFSQVWSGFVFLSLSCIVFSVFVMLLLFYMVMPLFAVVVVTRDLFLFVCLFVCCCCFPVLFSFALIWFLLIFIILFIGSIAFLIVKVTNYLPLVL